MLAASLGRCSRLGTRCPAVAWAPWAMSQCCSPEPEAGNLLGAGKVGSLRAQQHPLWGPLHLPRWSGEPAAAPSPQPSPEGQTRDRVLGFRRGPPSCPPLLSQAGPAPPGWLPTAFQLMLPRDLSAGESGTAPGNLLQRLTVLGKAVVNTKLDLFCCNLRLLSFVPSTQTQLVFSNV